MDRFDPYLEWLGIEPGERPPDHYQLLGLTRFDGDVKAIARSADLRMAEVRKHQTGPRGRHTQALLNQLASARLCLLNPDSKSRYDQRLRDAHQASAATENPRPADHSPAAIEPVSVPPHLDVPPPPPPPPPPRARAGAAVAAARVSPPATGRSNEPSPRHARLRRYRRVSSGTGCQMTLLLLVCLALAGFAWWAVWSRGNRPRAVADRETPVVTVRTQPSETKPGSGPTKPLNPATPDQTPRTGDPLAGPIVIIQEGSGEVNLPPAVGVLHGETIRLGDPQHPDAISQWTSMDDSIEWHFRLVKPGVFRMNIRYSVAPDAVGGEFELLVDGKTVKICTLRAVAEGQPDVTDEHFVPLPRGGEHRLELRPATKPGAELMRLFEVRLTPSAASRNDS